MAPEHTEPGVSSEHCWVWPQTNMNYEIYIYIYNYINKYTMNIVYYAAIKKKKQWSNAVCCNTIKPELKDKDRISFTYGMKRLKIRIQIVQNNDNPLILLKEINYQAWGIS